jgi:hypothetical protein
MAYLLFSLNPIWCIIFSHDIDLEQPAFHGILYLMQNKKEYAYYQSYARTSAVLPDMGQMEKERGQSLEWALKCMLPI